MRINYRRQSEQTNIQHHRDTQANEKASNTRIPFHIRTVFFS